ncbi:MAG: hypothetical protein RIC80_15145 [Cyclobacteriaceae bacterium]
MSRRCIPAYNGVPAIDYLIDLKDSDKLEKIRRSKLKVVADHCYFGANEEFGLGMKNPFYYTILRYPLERFISDYFYSVYNREQLNLKNRHINSLTNVELDLVLNIYSNQMVHWIAGGNQDKNSLTALDIAKRNLLHGYSCYGILEKLDASLEILSSKIPDWLSVEGIKMNKINTPDRLLDNSLDLKSSINADIKLKIIESNDSDFQLYNFACQNFLS